MTKATAKVLGMIGAFVLLMVVARAYRTHVLRTHGAVFDEVGLQLPDHVRVVKASETLFSLVDGRNVVWLLESTNSLLPWVEANMKPEEWGSPTNLAECLATKIQGLSNLNS
ncbi:MAG: hypothetical protein ACO1QB_16120 [Verrucomicrobiales bacterium]